MAQPTCPKCPSTQFTATAGPPVDGNNVHLVHCAQCGCVVGVVPTRVLNEIKRAADQASRR